MTFSDILNRTVTTVNVNSANADELTTVLGVSQVTAQRIIDRRRTRKLANVSDLKGIPGVDAAAVDSKSKLLYFSDSRPARSRGIAWPTVFRSAGLLLLISAPYWDYWRHARIFLRNA